MKKINLTISCFLSLFCLPVFANSSKTAYQTYVSQIVQSGLVISAEEEHEFSIGICDAKYDRETQNWVCYYAQTNTSFPFVEGKYYTVSDFVSYKFNGKMVAYTVVPAINSNLKSVIIFKYKKPLKNN